MAARTHANAGLEPVRGTPYAIERIEFRLDHLERPRGQRIEHDAVAGHRRKQGLRRGVVAACEQGAGYRAPMLSDVRSDGLEILVGHSGAEPIAAGDRLAPPVPMPLGLVDLTPILTTS